MGSKDKTDWAFNQDIQFSVGTTLLLHDNIKYKGRCKNCK